MYTYFTDKISNIFQKIKKKIENKHFISTIYIIKLYKQLTFYNLKIVFFRILNKHLQFIKFY